jgi:hypothetical protein
VLPVAANAAELMMQQWRLAALRYVNERVCA